MDGRPACVVVVLSLLLVAGCADDAGPDAQPAPSTSATEPTEPELLPSTTQPAAMPPPGATVVEMTGPPPRFVPSSLTVAAGDEAVFFLDNTSPTGDNHGGHKLLIGPEVDRPLAISDVLAAGDSATFTVEGLEPGTYAIWCGYLNHTSKGQVGTLTVG